MRLILRARRAASPLIAAVTPPMQLRLLDALGARANAIATLVSRALGAMGALKIMTATV